MIIKQLLLRSLLVGGSISLLGSSPVHAQTEPIGFENEVVLNPGSISGIIRIGNEPLQSALMRADSFPGGFSSVGTFIPETEPENLSEIIYTLVVDTPEDGSPRDYGVRSNGINVRADSFFDSYEFSTQRVPVLEFETTEVNFDFSNAGIVHGRVTTEGGATLVSADLEIFRNDTLEPVITRSRTRTTAASDRDGAYRFAASPGQVRFTCDGIVTVDGIRFGVEADAEILTIAENGELEYNCILPAPNTETFDIVGDINVSSDRERTHQITARGPTGSPAITTARANLTADGDYEFLDLALGRYSLAAFTSFEEGRLRLTHNVPAFNPGTVVTGETADEVITVDIDANVGFLEGNLNLLGSIDTSIVTSAQLTAGEADDAGTRFLSTGRSTFNALRTSIDTATPFVLAGHEDRSIDFSRATVIYNNNSQEFGERLDAVVTFTFPFDADTVVPVITNEVVNQDLDINFGEVTINFSTTDEDLSFTQPRVIGRCTLNGESGDVTYTSNVFADGVGENGFNQPDSRTGSVRFFAPAGVCQTVEARAQVNGSEPVFGIITDLIVEPGTIVDIDIEGPRLTVQSPAANSIISNERVDVVGLVTDDVSVDRVLVNGVLATLVSTDNPDDPNERSFSANIPLVLGANQILVEAFDGEDNRSSNERTVFSDNEAPTVVWTPADGTVIQSDGDTTVVNVTGTADDDTGIQSITLEGVSVDFVSTNNSERPNEVSFVTALDLVNGMNFLDVVVTDISGRQVMQVHRIDVTEVVNQPPVANAGVDQVIEQQNSTGAQVTLDGSNSSDPDGDDLSFVWVVNGEEFDTVNPTLTLPAGENTATLTVTDPSGASSSDTVTITIQDTTAPTFDVNKIRKVLFYNPHGRNKFELSTIASNIQDAVDGEPTVKIEVTGNQRKYNRWYSRWYKNWYKNYAVSHHGSKSKVWLKPEINYGSHPGIYKIKVTVTDAAGNSTTQVCKVKVLKKRLKPRPWYYWYK